MILVDDNEPENIIRLLRQSVTAIVSPLNRMHRSDYFFANYEGKTLQFSRKQAGELVGNVDEAEDQLVDYFNNADYNFQIVEGWISPLPIKGIEIRDHSPAKGSIRDLGNKLFCYQVQPNGYIERGHSFTAINDSALYAWEHRLAMAGIATYYTINWAATARLLAVIYRNEQKPPEEHSTLTRIIKPKFHVREERSMSDEDRDSFRLMKAVMFLSDAYKLGVGEKKAKVISSRFANLLDLAMADAEEIAQCEGIGNTIARKILTALGRTL